MPETKRKVATLQAESLHIPLGTALLIEPSGMGERFKSTFVGMERGRFIIAKIPRIPGASDHLYVEKGVTVRYLDQGNVYGFESSILSVATSPFRLLFLKYPDSLEALNLRNSHRLDCYLPAAIKLGADWNEGMILNLSSGGCQVVMEVKPGREVPAVAAEDDVMLEFKMFGTEQPIMIGGKARNINLNKNRLYMGVKFDELPEYSEKIISDYIRSVAEYLEA